MKEFLYNSVCSHPGREAEFLNARSAEGWRVAHVIPAFQDEDGSVCSPQLLLERDKKPTVPTVSGTSNQDLFDRWISEAIAAKANARSKETRVSAEGRLARIKTLLDCAAQLQCVASLPGPDPRDPNGLDEHMNRMADRARGQG